MQMNKRGNTKVESNDSPEIQDKTETSDIPRLPSGGSSLEPAVKCLLLRTWTSCHQKFFCQQPRFTTFLSITSDHCTYKSPDGFRCVDLSVLNFYMQKLAPKDGAQRITWQPMVQKLVSCCFRPN